MSSLTKNGVRNEGVYRARSTSTLTELMDELRRREIAERIKEARARAGLRQKEVAAALNLETRSYQKIEQVGITYYERAEELAEIFKVSAEWLWSGEESEVMTEGGAPAWAKRLENRLESLNYEVSELRNTLGLALTEQAVADLDRERAEDPRQKRQRSDASENPPVGQQ